MKYLRTLIILVTLSGIAFTTRFSAGYTITGTVNGLDDGTWLYLRTATPDVNIDSCQVRGGKFNMSGKVGEKAMQVTCIRPNTPIM